MDLNTNKHVALDDLVEYSRNRGINLPKSHLETMRTSLEQGSATPGQLIENVDAIAARYEEKGFKWYVQEGNDPKYPLMRFMDKSGHTRAYIVERVNKEKQENFFAANRINEKGEHLKLSSNNSLEAVREHVTAYYTGAVINEMAREMNQSKGAETPSAAQGQPDNRQTAEASLSR